MKLWASPCVACCAVILLLWCFGSECGTVRENKGRSKRDLVRIREAARAASFPGACATRLPRGKRSVAGLERRLPRQRRRSSQAEEDDSPGRGGKAVYFTGWGDQLRLKPGVEIPRGNFTLEMWIKPEGGQRSPTVIAGLYDKCFYASSDRGWLLGIKAVSEQGNRDPRFFFSLKTDRAHKVTSIHSNARYTPNQWAHLAVTYDGVYMKLYVNGAQVGVSREQSGDVFSHLTKKCKVLMIGGNALNHNYRGAVERVGLWRQARGQRQIIRDMQGHEDPQELPQLVIRENFRYPDRKWLTVKDGNFPKPEPGINGRLGYAGGIGGGGGSIGEGFLDTTLEPPPCGQTVCDNVDVIKHYNHLWNFRKPKTVRYRVINVWDDARKRPTVFDHQISLQHQHLNDAFGPYNITWELSVHNVTNSSLRDRLILANCDISKVGDDLCDPECNHPLTGYDAGDCTSGHRSRCPEYKQGNGVCDAECNLENFSYDLGDCCNPNVTDVTKTCFNRSSPHKRQNCPTCQSKVFDLSDGVSQYAWFPCREAHETSWGNPNYWLKAHFSHPMVAAAVIIHLAADGTGYLDQTQCNITVQLVDTKGAFHSLGDWRLSCRTNPLVIPVSHDLSVAFYHTKAILVTFASELVAVSGVGLRSFQSFDPITISGCQSNEIYNPTGQSCVHYSCEAIDCQEPLIRNAELKCSSPGRHFYNGDRCTIACDSGYVLQIHQDDDIIKSKLDSTVTITCADGKWNKQVSCEPVDCGLPDKYHVHPAHFVFPNGTTYGKKSVFQCKEPAQLVGTNNTLTCLEDGLWSFPEALCELRCPAPPPVPNAVLQTKRCNETGLKVGSLCKYKCRPGYHVANKPKRRAFKRQCTEDGRWIEGACEPVTCDTPHAIFHGSYHCTDGFRFDSVCRLNCSDPPAASSVFGGGGGGGGAGGTGGSAHTVRMLHAPCKQAPGSNSIRCRKDGNWTGSFRLCPQSRGQCSLPQNLHYSLQYSCKRGHGIGEDCELTCRESNNDVVMLPSNLTADYVLIEHWRNPPKVKSIVCTMALKWYPHPETLHCIKGCEPFMGDNYCDSVNNRAFCNYDGGDCCQSTVKTKKVIPFPMSCDIRDECSCRDPNSMENRKEEHVHSLG
ncbi:pregnancy-associated plasma protein A, pappalysin 1a [Gadus chalcogrammus]|uniref:pregnancy-associated plasma protein A, pappalysin 1a n=1 Tax=Gadus chalcogrammus TaxID=1042646 RepID=UPI0024C4CABA|nr:pregnancy-associated plasma protein A, pappalysin 1a [Gadus chalcogrammus]